MKLHGAYGRAERVIRHFDQLDLLIDVGVGKPLSEAWAFAEKYPQCHILGFEPNAARFRQLQPVYPGNTLRNVMVSDKPGTVTGFVSGSDDRTVLSLDSEGMFCGRAYAKEEYSAITLDSLPVDDFEKIFLWADIEGAELKMLKGATALLESEKVVGINLEVRATRSATDWCTFADVNEFLKPFGYVTRGHPPTGNKHKDILWRRA